MTLEPGWNYYAVHSNTHSIERVWDWVSEEGNCYMWKGRILGNVSWIAQIPQGVRNTVFVLRHSEHVDLL